LIVGALAGGGVAIAMEGSDAGWIVPAMVVAGAIGGALWGAIPALLKTRFNAEETLTTLMLSYVASLILSYMVNGPWRDPEGMNFPQSIMFSDSALFSILLEGSRVNTSVWITVFAVLAFWLFNARSFLHFQIEVGGLAPAASRYAGFSANRRCGSAC
jgi:general nucleoside transport system permease protein